MNQPPPENAILSAWRQTRQRRADAPAVLSPRGECLRTFSDIAAEAARLRARFAEFAPGAVVAVQIGNSASWPALLIALFEQQLIPLPLGRHVETGELDRALTTCHCAVLVRSEGEKLIIEPREAAPVRWPDPAPQLLKLTSGTTSAPRAVRFQAAQLLADAAQICDGMGIAENDRNFGVIPYSHSYGFSNLLTPLLCRGVALIASEDRLPRAILSDLSASEATVFAGMPVFFQKLAEIENAPALPALRLCVSAGALLPADVARRFTARFGLRIHSFYGASECGGICYDRADAGEYREGFVGPALPGVTIERPPKESAGPVVVRSAAVGDGYFPQEEPETLGSGRFAPSDLLRETGEGFQLEGRASDVINIAGRKLNPMEVEERLRGCAGVREAVVFGVPSALRGEEPIACVAAEQGLDAAAVLSFCQAHLSQWQRPRDVWFVPEIPVNERGKIVRRALAAAYLARPSRPRLG